MATLKAHLSSSSSVSGRIGGTSSISVKFSRQTAALAHLEYLPFDSRFHFPNIGDANVLYGDTTENKLYRYDPDDGKYYCVGSDYNDIIAIDGGHA